LAADGTVEMIRTPDGLAISVKEWGNPRGPEIVLIHGIAQSHLCFERQVHGDLARDFRLIAFDTRGHGASQKPSDPRFYHDAKAWADEVQAVIDAKGLRKPVLVGWSMGGRIIGQYLTVHGDKRLSGINFVGARVIADPVFGGPGLASLPAVRPGDFGSEVAFARGFLRACFAKQPGDKDFAIMLAYNMVLPRPVRDAMAGWPANIEATTAALRAVRCPVLVTHGRADAVVLPSAAERTLSLVPAAKASWYDDCGHSPFWEDTPRFNRELAEFVKAAWKPD
jgi:pimeloyl-ACP methyl ester carboxylesterase